MNPTDYKKYPRSFHLPFSLGLQNDDKRMSNEHCFNGKDVIVTVKMDGENTSLYREGLHARSLDSAHHPSRSVIKQIHSTIKNDIPEGWRICGENLQCKKSIHYTNLESFFYVFSVWNEKNEALSYLDTKYFCENLGLTHVEVVDCILDFAKEEGMSTLEKIYKEVVARGDEGIVVRNVDSFHYKDFQDNLVKAVRKDHVQTSVHWMRSKLIPNILRTSLQS